MSKALMKKMNFAGYRIIIGLLLVVLTLSSCSGGDDAEAIRKMVREGVSLGEKRDITGLLRLTTADFTARPGKIDRRETRTVLWRAFIHYGESNIFHPRPVVDIDQEAQKASAVFPFVIVKKGNPFPRLDHLYEEPQRWLEKVGESADLYRLKLELRKHEGEWLVRQAVLEQFTGWSFKE
jgi:hypothetical protein